MCDSACAGAVGCLTCTDVCVLSPQFIAREKDLAVFLFLISPVLQFRASFTKGCESRVGITAGYRIGYNTHIYIYIYLFIVGLVAFTGYQPKVW